MRISIFHLDYQRKPWFIYRFTGYAAIPAGWRAHSPAYFITTATGERMHPTLKSVERKTYIHILAPLFFASILAFLDRVNVSFAALTMNADLGFDPKVYGMGAGIFFAGYVLFEVPGAIVAERWSPSKWIARIMVTWGIVCMLMAYMTTATHFFILRFLLGACEASLYPVIYASIIPRWFTMESRPRAISITLTSLLLSAIIGAPLAGWLVSLSPFGLKGWQSLFLLEGAITVVYGFFILFWLKDDPATVKWLTQEEKDFLRTTIQAENAGKEKKQRLTIMQALTNPRVLMLCLIYFLWITGFWGFNFWMPTVLKKASNWSTLQVGFIATLPMLCALVAMVFIGNSSSKRRESRLHVGIPLVLASVGFLIGALSESTTVALISVFIVAIGVYSPMGVWWSIPTTFLTGAAAAGAVGLINSVGNIGGFIGPYVLGFIQSSTGNLSLGYYWLSGSLLASAILVFRLKKQA